MTTLSLPAPAVRGGTMGRDRLFPADRAAAYLLLIILGLITVLPLLYMISLALQTDAEAFAGDPVIIPSDPQWSNFVRLFEAAPFGRFFVNSFIMAGAITISHLIFDPLIGYVFAKFNFAGKNIAFIALLTTLMVPFFVRMLPIYALFSNLGWIDTYRGLIVPFLMDAYGIFLMRQFIQTLPDELIEAARVDGASELRIYAQVILPQLKPALAVLALLTFVFQWNEFLWPLIATSSTEMRTMPIGLTLFNQEYFTQWNLTAAGALILFIPTAIFFVVTQKFLVEGISLSGIK
jgi:multiple sugar transport system permease protein